MDAAMKQEVQTLIKDTLVDFQQHLEKTRDKAKEKELEDRIKDMEEVNERVNMEINVGLMKTFMDQEQKRIEHMMDRVKYILEGTR